MNDGIKRTLVVTAAVGVAAVIFLIWNSTRRHSIPIPDEKVVAMELLAEKLSGPRYFNAPLVGIQDSGEPWIAREEVDRQEDRVVLERHWGQSQKAELDQLISRLTESGPARMVGGYRIPLERLNLALDSIKE